MKEVDVLRYKIAILLLVIVLVAATGCAAKVPDEPSSYVKPVSISSYERTMRQDLLCLMLAYPEYILGLQRLSNGDVYIVMKSGQKLLYDDKKVKNSEQKLTDPDLQDMLEQPYPLTFNDRLMDVDFDPGRVRVYGLLEEVYGGNQKQIEAQLENVRVGNGSFQFNKGIGASAALKEVMAELALMVKQNSKVAAAAFPSSGTYNYRKVSQTNRLSPHAFGIAIDMARDKRDYWQWITREEGQKRLEAYPRALVEVFEKHNFIWGGKWGHFDMLHYEYRPEIMLKARYFGKEADASGEWYKGAAAENPQVKEYIIRINEALK